MFNLEVIPTGQYCYNVKNLVFLDGEVRIRTRECPYWSINHNYPNQLNGFCSYLNKGDWETNGLLWDGIKECNVNLGEK